MPKEVLPSSKRNLALLACSTVLIPFNLDCAPDGTLGGNTLSPTVQVRKNINSLSPTEINSLRRGVAAMKERTESDPTSWWYQANIHGTPQGAANSGWQQCEHGSFQFLAWHRIYLYYFERILRDAAGNPNLTLPYWNYSDTSSADNRAIPLPYRDPAEEGNALFEVNRGDGWNLGARLPPSAVDTGNALSPRDFLPAPGGLASQSFGGGNPFGPGRLEVTPHNTVHSNIGAWMGHAEFAAQDPLFWAHHCNIDRLWEGWLALGDGRTNPSNDAFLNQEYTFFDETGKPVTRRVGDFLDLKALGYQYESLGTTSEVLTLSAFPASRDAEESDPRILSEVSNIELRGEIHSVTMPSWKTGEGTANLAKTLALEELRFEEAPVGHYEVYINLPEGTIADYESKYFVGNLSFFRIRPTSPRRPQTSARIQHCGRTTGTHRCRRVEGGPSLDRHIGEERARTTARRCNSKRRGPCSSDRQNHNSHTLAIKDGWGPC